MDENIWVYTIGTALVAISLAIGVLLWLIWKRIKGGDRKQNRDI